MPNKHKITKTEMIARQAVQLEELRDTVDALNVAMREAKSHITCVGGPLNDNKLGYSNAQLVTFHLINECLVGLNCG